MCVSTQLVDVEEQKYYVSIYWKIPTPKINLPTHNLV
jgi:hypothetical protein